MKHSHVVTVMFALEQASAAYEISLDRDSEAVTSGRCEANIGHS
jgi:hypothetical protein